MMRQPEAYSYHPQYVLMCSIRHGFSHLESVSHFRSSS